MRSIILLVVLVAVATACKKELPVAIPQQEEEKIHVQDTVKGATDQVTVYRDSMEDGNLGKPWFGVQFCNAVHMEVYERGNVVTAIANGPNGFWAFRRFTKMNGMVLVSNQTQTINFEIPDDTLLGRPNCDNLGGRRKGERWIDCYYRNVDNFPCDPINIIVDVLNPKAKVYAAAIACSFFEDGDKVLDPGIRWDMQIVAYQDHKLNKTIDGRCGTR